MTKVAVAILNYNGCQLLRKFLPEIVKYSADAKVVLIDNASTDGSQAMIAKEFPSVELIQLPANLGYCGGYNLGLKKVEADYYMLLNSDVEVTPGWLDPLIALLESNAKAAAVQPKVLSYNQKNLFEYAGAGGGYIDSMGYPFCRGRLFYSIEEDTGQYNDRTEIFWSSGACMMIRASLFHSSGGFDEDFFAHMEEIDLCWRLQRAGHKIFYEGKSTVYHVGGGTLSVLNPMKTYLNFKNGLSLLYKNLPTGELILKFPVRIILDWIASLKFTLSGSPRDGAAVIRAHWHFFGNLGKERHTRRETSGLGYHKPANQYRGWIVWDFFVSGIRKYSALKK